jgi:hypothetical protein
MAGPNKGSQLHSVRRRRESVEVDALSFCFGNHENLSNCDRRARMTSHRSDLLIVGGRYPDASPGETTSGRRFSLPGRCAAGSSVRRPWRGAPPRCLAVVGARDRDPLRAGQEPPSRATRPRVGLGWNSRKAISRAAVKNSASMQIEGCHGGKGAARAPPKRAVEAGVVRHLPHPCEATRRSRPY